MGYVHIFLFFICINFGLGMTTVADTPISLPSTLDRCFTQMNDNGPINPNSAGGSFPILVHANGTATAIGSDFIVGGGGVMDEMATPTDADTGNPWDPITEAIEMSGQVVDTIINFLTGGFITQVLDHVAFTCDLDPNSPTYGEPQFPDIWLYFITGIKIIFGVLLVFTLFYIITGKSFPI